MLNKKQKKNNFRKNIKHVHVTININQRIKLTKQKREKSDRDV